MKITKFHCTIDNFMIIVSAWINFAIVNSSHHENHDIRDLLRNKRSLLFPNPLDSETKVQVLFGLGLPMEGEVSMTLGYVLKCNYDLPYNVSDFSDGPYVRYARDIHPEEISESSSPLKKQSGSISRWSLYRMIEMLMTTDENPSRGCLLRAVCEAAEFSFRHGRHGILGEILDVFFAPSTTQEEYEIYEDREYHAAEIIGRDSDGQSCRVAYHDCHYSPLDYFTKKYDFSSS